MRKALVGITLLVAAGALAANSSTLKDLALFKNSPLDKGLWRVELISSNDPLISKGASAMGNVGICMDVAERLTSDTELDDAQCSPTIVKNTAEQAEVNVTCTDGQHSHLKVTRETEQRYLIESISTDSNQKQRQVTARYQYQGACQGDSAIQMDKNSSACKMLNQVDMAKLNAMCANAPAAYRAQCEQQLKAVSGSCQ